MTLPSVNSMKILLFSTHTLIAVGSSLKVCIILLLYKFNIFKNKPFNISQHWSRNSLIAGEFNRIQPKFTFTIRRFYMYMRRLITLI